MLKNKKANHHSVNYCVGLQLPQAQDSTCYWYIYYSEYQILHKHFKFILLYTPFSMFYTLYNLVCAMILPFAIPVSSLAQPITLLWCFFYALMFSSKEKVHPSQTNWLICLLSCLGSLKVKRWSMLSSFFSSPFLISTTIQNPLFEPICISIVM